MGFYTEKTLLITGGTGSFGKAVLNRLMATDLAEIRVFSRDEKKQDDLRHELKMRYGTAQKVKFYLGDVRDYASVKNVMQGTDFVFHAAALKQVPSCEFFPLEAVKTNVLGTENVLSAAAESGVRAAVCLSTDKAAYPVNAMGLSKALMEKVAVAKSQTARNLKICCTRYGNVLCSRGSVVPLWVEQIRAGLPLTVTDPAMTRFIMTLEEAVDLVLFALEHGNTGDILIQKAPACTLETLAKAVCAYLGVAENIQTIGIRPGEKLHETLLTSEEYTRSVDEGDFYRIPQAREELDYERFFTGGTVSTENPCEFRSDTARQLTVDAVREKLSQTSLMQNALKGL